MYLRYVLLGWNSEFKQVNKLLLGVNHDDIRVEFWDNDVNGKGTPISCVARHIGEDLDEIGIRSDGVFRMFQEMQKKWVMMPGESAVIMFVWTHVVASITKSTTDGTIDQKPFYDLQGIYSIIYYRKWTVNILGKYFQFKFVANQCFQVVFYHTLKFCFYYFMNFTRFAFKSYVSAEEFFRRILQRFKHIFTILFRKTLLCWWGWEGILIFQPIFSTNPHHPKM